MSVQSSAQWDEQQRLLQDTNDPDAHPKQKSIVDHLRSAAAFFTLAGMLACWIGELEYGTFMAADCFDDCCAFNFSETTTTPVPAFEHKCAEAYRTKAKYTCADEQIPIPGCATNFFVTYCTRIGWSSVFIFWSIWANCIHVDPTGVKSPMASAIGTVGWRALLKWVLPLGVIIFCSSYTWYVSFAGTSPDGNSAVYQSAPVFVFLISVPLLGEKVTLIKVVSVLLCCGGVAEIMVVQSNGGGKDTIVGYSWLLISVLLYALYEVLFKKYCTFPDDPYPVANSQRFFSLCGFVGVFTMWPLFFILDYTGYEKFHFPDNDTLPKVAVMAALDVGFNSFLVLTVLLSSPLFTSVGTNTVIPVTLLTDYLIHGNKPHPWTAVGIAMVAVGFSGMIYSEHQEHKAKHQH